MNEAAAATGKHDESTWYLAVWLMLVVLLMVGLAIFVLPISRPAAITLIFGVAAVKAALVLRNYMHLKRENILIYAIVLVPFLFIVGLAIALVPDIVFRHVR